MFGDQDQKFMATERKNVGKVVGAISADGFFLVRIYICVTSYL